MCDWIDSELKTVDFGDKRLDARFGNLLELLNKKPTESIPNACKSWSETKGAYRFFDNENVSAEKILAPHYTATTERIKQEPIVLLVQDTTEIDYTKHPATDGLGHIGKTKHTHRHGFFMHPTLAVTPSRVSLGFVDNINWIRTEQNKAVQRKQLPISEKESQRWLDSFSKTKELAKQIPETHFVNVADRESDIYEYFMEYDKNIPNADLIVRAVQNRCLEDSDKKLWEKVRGEQHIATIEFELPRGRNNQSRLVRQEIRAVEVTLVCPARHAKKLPNIKLTAILATEISPPENVKPIEWLLLTTIKTNSKEEVLSITEYYLCRWQIEIFFNILKTGCQIEKVQLENYNRLTSCLALYMIIAWRILHITMFNRVLKEVPCNEFFSDCEWKSMYTVYHKGKQQLPVDVPSIYEMTRMIASFGGFLGRKHDKEPGVKSIWLGMQQMHVFALAYEAFNVQSKNSE